MLDADQFFTNPNDAGCPEPKSHGAPSGSIRDTSLATYLVEALSRAPGHLSNFDRREAVTAATRKLKRHTRDFFWAASPHRARRIDPATEMIDRVWVQRGAAGLGKTDAYVEKATFYARQRNLRVLILLPDYRMVDQVATKIPDAVRLMGREQPGRCLRPDLVRKAMECGLPVEEAICTGCPQRWACPYQATIREIVGTKPSENSDETETPKKGCIVLATHEQLIYYRPRLGFHVVLIDENCLKVFEHVTSLHPDRFDAAIARDPGLARALTKIRDAVRVEDGRILSALRESGFTTARKINRVSGRLERLDEAELSGLDLNRPDSELMAELEQRTPGDFRKLARLLRQLAMEISLPRDTANGIVYRERRVSVNGALETQERIDVFGRHELAVPKSVPILVTDASADDVLLRQIWPNLLFTDIPAPRNAVTVQATSAKFDRYSLESGEQKARANVYGSEGYLRQVTGFIGKLGAKRPLLVTYKKIAALLDEPGQPAQLPSNCAIAYFGALRGRNDWETCDAIVIAGRQQPAPDAIERLVRCFWNDDPEPIPHAPELKGWETALQGTGTCLEVEGYTDRRFQAVLRQIREEEICQALDRLRLVHAALPKLVVLLNKVDLGLPIDLALSWPDLHGKAVKILNAMRQSQVIRKNPDLILKDLAPGHGWRRGKQFREDLRVLLETVGADETAGLQKLFPSFHLFRYRTWRNGKVQAGKPSEAWVRETVGDPAAELEARYRKEGVTVTVRPA